MINEQDCLNLNLNNILWDICNTGVPDRTCILTETEQAIPYVVQNTTNSMQDPLPGHESHQVVYQLT